MFHRRYDLCYIGLSTEGRSVAWHVPSSASSRTRSSPWSDARAPARTTCCGWPTEAGLEALREHARTPVQFPPVKSDPLLRLLMCDLVGEKVTRESLATLRDDIADIWWRLDAAEESAHGLPHRERYLLLVVDFLRRLLQLHLDLVDEVERELAPSGRDRRRQAPRRR